MEYFVPAPALVIAVKGFTALVTARGLNVRVVGNEPPAGWDWSLGNPLLVIADAGGTALDHVHGGGALMHEERFALEVYAGKETDAMRLSQKLHGLAAALTETPGVYRYQSVGSPNSSPHPDRAKVPRWVSYVSYRFRSDITE